MQPDKYNYVIYSYPLDYFRIMFSDVIKQDNVEYIDNPIAHFYNNKLAQFLYNFHNNDYLNYLFKLPFKHVWLKHYYRDDFRNPKQKCFIFLMGWLVKENEPFFEILKMNYPDCKLLIYFEDLVSTRGYLDLSLIKKYFNLAISYDEEDAKRHNFYYYPTFLSKIDVNDNPDIANSDACFIGAAKARYDQIIRIYETLQESGVRCDFQVSRMNKGQKRHTGIRYIPYMIPYSEYLEHTNKSNCIVEIMQEHAVGYTLRTWEALIYGKKLLTNNPSILSAPFYNDEQFRYFERADDIDASFTKSRLEYALTSMTDKPSPIHFLHFIETIL